MSSEDHYMKEPDPEEGVTRIRWIRHGHPNSFLDLHPPGFYRKMPEPCVPCVMQEVQKLRAAIHKALTFLTGNELELNAFKARAHLLAAIVEIKEEPHEK